MMNAEEKIVIHELKAGNEAVFEHVFKAYYSGLVRFSEGMLFDPYMAEDEVQQLFVHLWEKADRLEIKTSLKSYLYQAARNRCLNRLKSIQVYDKNKKLYKEGILNSGDMEHVEDESIYGQIQSALEQLPDQQKQVAKLKYMEGKKYAEVADSLDVSINTVKTQLSRARESLRKILDKVVVWLPFLLGQ